MKAGRVIGGDEHDARTLADKIVEEARGEAERLKRDASELAAQLVRDARIDAERRAARATDSGVSSSPAPSGPASGTVDEVVGLVIRATVPGVALGEVLKVDRRGRVPLAAEVVGFRGEQAGTAGHIPRHHREPGALHRAVRHRLGHHVGLRGHRRPGLD